MKTAKPNAHRFMTSQLFYTRNRFLQVFSSFVIQAFSFCTCSDSLRHVFLFKLCHQSKVAVLQGVNSANSSVWLMLCSYCFWHAGCARMVLIDACLCAGKAHASVMTVFKAPSASEEMKTVQRMNANYLILLNHGVIVDFFLLQILLFFSWISRNNNASSVPISSLNRPQGAAGLLHQLDLNNLVLPLTCSSPHMAIGALCNVRHLHKVVDSI